MPIGEARKHHRKRVDRHERKRIRDNRIVRWCIAAGAVLLALRGWSARVRGEEGWLNYSRHEYVWANIAIISGVIVFIVAVAPWSLIRQVRDSTDPQDKTSAPPRRRG